MGTWCRDSPCERMLYTVLMLSVLVPHIQARLTCYECGNANRGNCYTPGTLYECPTNDHWCSIVSVNGIPESRGCEHSSVHTQHGYMETEADSGKWCKKDLAGRRITCVCGGNKCNLDDKPAKPGAWRNGGTKETVGELVTVVTLLTLYMV